MTTTSSPNGRAISHVAAREIFDSRGRPTVEVEVRLGDGTLGRAAVPSGASTGSAEARERRDGDPNRHDGRGVLGAVQTVRTEIAAAVRGLDATAQGVVDARLVELDALGRTGSIDSGRFARLGANATLGVSLAACRAAAAHANVPLHRHIAALAGVERPRLPVPMTNVLSGGLHAGRSMDLQDVLVVPCSDDLHGALHTIAAVRAAADRVVRERGLAAGLADEGGLAPGCPTGAAALELMVEILERSGTRPGEGAQIALDVAAHSLADANGGFHFPTEQVTRDPAGLADLVAGWVRDFPVVSVEDPLDEDDWAGWTSLTERLGDRVDVVGDDLFVTDPERLRRGVASRAGNAVLVKVNQNGTLSGALECVGIARSAGYAVVVSARSGETEDPFIADLAVGVAADSIKIGSFRTSERLAKYNQLVRIAEDGLPYGPESQ